MAQHNKIRVTRKVLKCPVFGSPRLLSGCMLPTYEDTMRYYLFVKNDLKRCMPEKLEPTVADVSKIVVKDVVAVCQKSSIPVVLHTRVLKLLHSYHDKYMKLLKPYKSRQNDEKYTEKINSFRQQAKQSLFDIACCKCDNEKYKCTKDRKVPIIEYAFLQDQRTLRVMFISGVDKLTSKKLRNKHVLFPHSISDMVILMHLLPLDVMEPTSIPVELEEL